jgi:nucleoid DNA-binding protein
MLPPVPSPTSRPELIAKVKAALGVGTREAERVAGAVVGALEDSLVENVDRDGYSLKLGKFGKFSICHRPGSFRGIPLTGETRMTGMKRKVKFVAIGRLRQLERVGNDGRTAE